MRLILPSSPLFAGAAMAAVVAGLPFASSDLYVTHIATLVCTYWVLVAGLNLLVGFMGQLSIGHVGLLAVGSYTFVILERNFGISPELSLLFAAGAGSFGGLLLGIPALRLPGFYFAMATLAFSTIVIEIATARVDLTGGGAGMPAPTFSPPFATPQGFYWLCAAIAMVVTILSWNLVRGAWGRAMIAIRDSEIAASSVGISLYRVKLIVFIFSGAVAGLAGALFASLQTYITTDTFHLELGLFFFICIVIGGRGSILGPLLGTILLTALPELVSSFAAVSGLVYGFVLLTVVLLVPGGMSQALEYLFRRGRRGLEGVGNIPDLDALGRGIKLGAT